MSSILKLYYNVPGSPGKAIPIPLRRDYIFSRPEVNLCRHIGIRYLIDISCLLNAGIIRFPETAQMIPGN
ncbi:hypothetical protein GCM10011506_18120 [Marivirga lumbricoides]|uniref:Uncharacterized protein n=1 Tax=Marivirga lumbricoides TaxID=1046115 RepID=A0ABQ1M235_9BACT|nr:hypothetical protein GCM10011506_18120 [Marivirga lumbricoides]